MRIVGFNIVLFENIGLVIVFILYIFMFIGVLLGLIGGGIKIIIFGILIFYVFGVLKRKEYVEVFKRRIDWELINKVLVIVIIFLFYIIVVIIILLLIESFLVDKVIYEVILVFLIIGLSMGIIVSLGIILKFLIIIIMFIGRLGFMIVVLVFINNKKSLVKYFKEDILIG